MQSTGMTSCTVSCSQDEARLIIRRAAERSSARARGGVPTTTFLRALPMS